MPYRKVGSLEQCWYLLKYKIEDLLGADHEDHGKLRIVETAQPDGSILVHYVEDDSGRKMRKKGKHHD